MLGELFFLELFCLTIELDFSLNKFMDLPELILEINKYPQLVVRAS